MNKSTFCTISLLSIFLIYFGWFSEKKVAPPITLKETTFEQLPGWNSTKVTQSLKAFQSSCRTFLRQNAGKSAGNQHIAIQISDLRPICHAAMSLTSASNKQAMQFFETWFKPVEYYQEKPVYGLFTGYYMPELAGSLTRTKDYTIPLYGLPSDRIVVDLARFKAEFKNKRITGRVEGNQLLPYYTREEISHGALRGKAPILFWIKSPIDRLFLETEGSGVIRLDNGQTVHIGYAGENGRPYQSIASILIKQGIFTKDEASSAHIKQYLAAHPETMHTILNQNQSFVFYRKLQNNAAIGAQGVPLTPGFSLAVDRSWIPYGTPVWLNTTSLNRLMVAQDTGSAIKGVVRGDVFWGDGKKAAIKANHMREQGRYWLLLPRTISR